MDPFRLCLALGPVAVYMLLLGAINISRRPFLLSGTRDAAVLGVAVSGLVIIGPVELFFPDAAAIRLGSYVWLLLLALYVMCLILVLLQLRPRLIVYNVAADELRPILADLVTRLDADARWAGDSLSLPNLKVQLHLDSLPTMRNVSLVANGPNQDPTGWQRLELELRSVLDQFEVSRNPRGLSLISAGLLITILIVLAIARDPQAVAQSLFDMFRL